MTGKAFVSGGSSGIGQALAIDLAARGWQVWTCGRNEAGLKLCRQAQPEIKTMVCDLSRRNEISSLAQSLATEAGNLDLVINNAGVFHATPLLEEDEDTIKKILALNLEAPIWIIRDFHARGLLGSGSHLLSILSVAAEKVFAGCATYAASKAGLQMLMKTLREELREKGIRVSNVCPGATLTPVWGEQGQDLGERIMDPALLAQAILDAALQPANIVMEEIVLRPPLGDL